MYDNETLIKRVAVDVPVGKIGARTHLLIVEGDFEMNIYLEELLVRKLSAPERAVTMEAMAEYLESEGMKVGYASLIEAFNSNDQTFDEYPLGDGETRTWGIFVRGKGKDQYCLLGGTTLQFL